MDKTISFSKDFWAVPVPCTIEDAIEDIQTGRWEARVAAVRAIPDEAKREEAKRRLPAYVFGGTFSGRRAKDALQKHSGFLVLDFDAKDNPGQTAEGMRALCAADVHCVFAFASARGGGCKAVVRVEAASAAEHERCFDAAAAWFKDKGLIADPTGRDVCRLCFVSHDPGLLRGLGAKAFAPAPCQWRGALLERAADGCPDRDTYECNHPAMRTAHCSTPADADFCRACKYRDSSLPSVANPATLGMIRETDLDDKLEKRARAYLRKEPPAIQGQRGSDALFKVAVDMTVGFCLSKEDAILLIMEEYNPMCQPPWSEREVAHKVEGAAKNARGLEPGYLKDRDDRPALTVVPPLPIEAALFKRKKAMVPSAREAIAPFLHPGGLIEEVARFIGSRAYVSQPELDLLAAANFVGSVEGRCVCGSWQGVDFFTNLYVLAVAESGRGKDAAFGALAELCAECGCANLLAPDGYKSAPALAEDIEEALRRFAMLDEIGQTFQALSAKGSGHGIAIEFRKALLTMWSAANRACYRFATSKTHKSAPVAHPFLSIYGTGTPQSVFAGLTHAALEDGFMGRWLIVPGRAEKAYRKSAGDAPAPVPQSIKNSVAAWLRRMDAAYGDGDLVQMSLRAGNTPTVRPKVTRFGWGPGAREAMLDWRGRYDEAEGLAGDAAPLWTRAIEKAAKLSLIRAADRAPDAMTISEEDVAWGAGLTFALSQQAQAMVERDLADNEVERLRKKMLDYIRGGREMGRAKRDVLHKCCQTVPKYMVDDALAMLGVKEGTGEIVEVKGATTVKGGRPSERLIATEWYSEPPVAGAIEENPNVMDEGEEV